MTVQCSTRSRKISLGFTVANCWLIVWNVGNSSVVWEDLTSAKRMVGAGRGSLLIEARIYNWSGRYRSGAGLVSAMSWLGTVASA